MRVETWSQSRPCPVNGLMLGANVPRTSVRIYLNTGQSSLNGLTFGANVPRTSVRIFWSSNLSSHNVSKPGYNDCDRQFVELIRRGELQLLCDIRFAK